MLSFLTRSEPSRGLVFFRGRTPHRPEEYQFLTKLGVSGKLGKRSDAAHWTLELSHKQWGSASLIALRDIPMPDAATVQYSAGLSDQDRTEMAGAGWAVALTAPASRGHVLRDRKNFLRYLRAVMGTDALMSVDSQSMLFWPRGRLDDELQHDADLDVEALYCIHAVSDRQNEEEAPIPWVHTHGLGELGAYDFDILNCHPAVGSVSGGDLFRGIAFSLLEGELKPGAEVLVRAPGSPVRAVEAGEFQAKAHAPDAALRDHIVRLFSTARGPEAQARCLSDLLCCLPGVSAPADLGYRDIFRVLIMQFIDAHNFDVRAVKRSCVHIVQPDGRMIPFETFNLLYRDDATRESRGAPQVVGSSALARDREVQRRLWEVSEEAVGLRYP